jgi:microcompartment protein CcmK/EutM
MIIARVVGSAVATVKAGKLSGFKLLIVQEVTANNKPLADRAPFVAVDTVGAGEGELVFVITGSSARYTDVTENVPVDAAIVAIVDSLEVDGETSFRKA